MRRERGVPSWGRVGTEGSTIAHGGSTAARRAADGRHDAISRQGRRRWCWDRMAPPRSQPPEQRSHVLVGALFRVTSGRSIPWAGPSPARPGGRTQSPVAADRAVRKAGHQILDRRDGSTRASDVAIVAFGALCIGLAGSGPRTRQFRREGLQGWRRSGRPCS
jgi:hypothetical protein